MSVLAAELILYSCASRPVDDASTTGGAISLLYRPVLTQWSAAAVAAVISDGADVRTVTLVGRDSSGTSQTEVLTLNGAVEVVGSQSWERILSATASATSATRTISIKQGSAGTVRATIPVNEQGVHILFRNSASAAGAVTRYEKCFFKNTNGSAFALTSATVTLTSDSSSRIRIGLAATVDDTATITNRLTSPGVVLNDDNVAITVGTGSLAASSAIGIWVAQELLSADNPFKSSCTIQLAGSTS